MPSKLGGIPANPKTLDEVLSWAGKVNQYLRGLRTNEGRITGDDLQGEGEILAKKNARGGYPGLDDERGLKIFGRALTIPASNTIYKDNVCKAWIVFDGTAVVSGAGGSTTGVLGSFNASKVEDNGIGDYTVYWDRDFANEDYAVTDGIDGAGNRSIGTYVGAKLVGSYSVRIRQTVDQALVDAGVVMLAAFGDQT